MNSFVDKLLCRKHDDESSGDELFDEDAVGLSNIGEAVHSALGKHHNHHHHSMWNVTKGKIIGSVDDTPKSVWDTAADPGKDNDDWFPEKLAGIIKRTETWCDVMSLGPPDGRFLTAFQDALQVLAERSKTSENPIIIRMLFGNIAGMPVNCNGVIKALTKDLPKDAKLQIWVGAWRKGFSWNHAKLIAVDGVYLHTGGHNLWDAHYLQNNPVHDLSFELEGSVARDGHRFANQQWQFIESKQNTCIGCVVDTMPDYLPLVLRTRVTVSEWPKDTTPVFPPQFSKSKIAKIQQSRHTEVAANISASVASNVATEVPLISIGRQGTVIFRSRPSDDAILAMINSSEKIIRLVLQDLGPVCLPGTKKALPGLKWPKEYLAAMGKAIYERGVDIEMVLSNPNSIPGGLNGTEANYGNGWDCVDVAAEIIKSIQKQHSEIDDAKLRAMVLDNLRICFIRHGKSAQYEDGETIGLHSKHFIVDDKCCYIGSQNLYMCDLAEWGIVVDSETEVKKIMNDYFTPMWNNSYTGEDVDVERVMDGLDVDRDGEETGMFSLQNADAAQMAPHGAGVDFYDVENDNESDVADETDAKEISLVPEIDDEQGVTMMEEKEMAIPKAMEPPTSRDDIDVDQDSASEERDASVVTPPQESTPSVASAPSQEIAPSVAHAPSEETTPSVTHAPSQDAAPSVAPTLTQEAAPSVARTFTEADTTTCDQSESIAPTKETVTTLATIDVPAQETAIVLRDDDTHPSQEDVPQQKPMETEQEEKKSEPMIIDCCGFTHSFGIASE